MLRKQLVSMLGILLLILAALVVGGCGQNLSSTTDSSSSYDEGTLLPSITVYSSDIVSGNLLLTPGESVVVSIEVEDDDTSGYRVEWDVETGTLSSNTGENIVYTAPSESGSYLLTISAKENPDGSGGGSVNSYDVIVSPWKYVDVEAPSYTYYYAFSALDYYDNNNIWAVGWDCVYKYNGTNWVSEEVAFNGHLDCVSVVSANDVWAFGWYFGQAGIYCHYDGNQWVSGYFTPPPNGADFASSNKGWVVANGGVIKEWNGTTWEAGISPTTNNLNAVVAKSDIFAWVVGDKGTILRYLGVIWENFQSPTTENLNDIVFNSSNDGWIVGDKGTILHWDGTVWGSVESPTDINLKSIAFCNELEGWIIGRDSENYEEVVFCYDGSNWSELFRVSINTFSDVAFTSDNKGWMVGNKFMRYYP